MEFKEKEEQIVKYLNKNYIVKNKLYFNNDETLQEWGLKIIKELSVVFSFEEEICETIFRNWAYSKGLTDEEIHNAFGAHKLKTKWSPELAQDLLSCNREVELTEMLIEQLEKEIDIQMIKDLKPLIKEGHDLLNIMKCIGYTTSPTLYSNYDFTPYKSFVSMKYHEIQEERNTNPFWKHWVNMK